MNIDYQKLSQIESDFTSLDGQVSKGNKSSEYHWLSTSRTDKGRVRPVNEDAFYQNVEQGVWAVADGMGGHSRGDRASKAVVDELARFIRSNSLVESIKQLESCFLKANEVCRTVFPHKKIGSTVAALFPFRSYCFFLWAGDSRVYRLRDSVLTQMTEDHSLAQEKFKRGEMSKEEADSHKTAHVLTRAIGVHRNLRIELGYSETEPGDRYLLCSDGLYLDLNDNDIQSGLSIKDPDQAIENLIQLALEKGGRDNITAMIVQSN